MTRSRFVAGLVLVLATPLMAAPDFTGPWKLVADKSDYGPLPVPEKLEQTITHKDPALTISTLSVGQQGERKVDMSFDTTGKETTNDLGGNKIKSVAKWEGEVLTVNSKLEVQGNEVTFADKYRLEDGGKTMVLERKINSPQGELEMKIVTAKQ